MAQRLRAFQHRFSAKAHPFTWKFTAAALRERLKAA